MLHAIHFSYRIGPINVHKPEFSLACTSSGQALNQKKHHSSDKYSLRTCILLQYDLHKLRYRVMCAVLISNRTKKFTHMSFCNLYVIWTSIGSDKIAVQEVITHNIHELNDAETRQLTNMQIKDMLKGIINPLQISEDKGQSFKVPIQIIT